MWLYKTKCVHIMLNGTHSDFKLDRFLKVLFAITDMSFLNKNLKIVNKWIYILVRKNWTTIFTLCSYLNTWASINEYSQSLGVTMYMYAYWKITTFFGNWQTEICHCEFNTSTWCNSKFLLIDVKTASLLHQLIYFS